MEKEDIDNAYKIMKDRIESRNKYWSSIGRECVKYKKSFKYKVVFKIINDSLFWDEIPLKKGELFDGFLYSKYLNIYKLVDRSYNVDDFYRLVHQEQFILTEIRNKKLQDLGI